MQPSRRKFTKGTSHRNKGVGIPKVSVNKFLNRERDDYRTYKSKTFAQLQAECDALPVQPPIWFRLRKHQRACFLLGAKLKSFAFFLDTGMGKTLLSVALTRYFKKAGLVKRVLVLVPNRVNTGEWVRDLEKHSPGTSICVLSGSSEQKWEKLETTKSTIIVVTYGGLIRMVTELVEKKKKPDTRKLMIDTNAIARLCSHIQGLFLDESTTIQHHAKLPFRVCMAIAKRLPNNIVFCLTGTPHGRDPAPLWAQMKIVDGGHALGETLGLFRAAFYRSEENPFGGWEHTFNKRMKHVLHRNIAARSIRYEADAASLPEVVPIIKEVTLPADTHEYYERARQMMLKSHGNYKEQKNAFLRMRQISSGFMGYKDDDRGVRAEIEFTPNPKLEMLLSIIESIRPDRKIIVFHDFVFAGSMIHRELTDLGIKHARIGGKVKDEQEQVKLFVNDPDCRVFVVSNSAGAFGGNWQIAQYSIYYESPVSPIIRIQTERRNERQESAHKTVFRYDLVAKGTEDQRILDFHKEGKDLFEAIVNGRA